MDDFEHTFVRMNVKEMLYKMYCLYMGRQSLDNALKRDPTIGATDKVFFNFHFVTGIYGQFGKEESVIPSEKRSESFTDW